MYLLFSMYYEKLETKISKRTWKNILYLPFYVRERIYDTSPFLLFVWIWTSSKFFFVYEFHLNSTYNTMFDLP